MGTVDDYLASLAEPGCTQVGALFAIATETAAAQGGDVVQGESYGMPALLYRGKGPFTAQLTAKHVGVYPFSANAVGHVVQELGAGAHAKGALRYRERFRNQRSVPSCSFGCAKSMRDWAAVSRQKRGRRR